MFFNSQNDVSFLSGLRPVNALKIYSQLFSGFKKRYLEQYSSKRSTRRFCSPWLGLVLIIMSTQADTATEIQAIVDTVNAVNALESVDDSYTILTNVSSTLSVLENDNYPEGGLITLSSATASHGVVEIVDGELIYTPPENFTGTVIIEYLIKDEDGGYDTAIVILYVEGNGEGPTIIPPATVWVDANALYTKVELGVALAFDSLGNAIPVTLVRENSYFKPGVNYALWE
ncbi:MAG: hypothetical protein GY829_12265, partial [Gammaproteobacteria bacterium]|nr:hypothetical protein [Gammaproteobacteria bacterium]